VRAVDGGRDPYGALPAPLGIRTLTQQWMVIPPGAYGAGDYDAARDALLAAVAHGYPVTLVYRTDSGRERIATAKFFGIKDTPTPQSPFAHTFAVTWEVKEWTDRYARNVPIIGLVAQIIGGTPAFAFGGIVYALTANPTTVTVDASGGDGLPSTTRPDTAPIIVISGAFGGDVTYDATGLPLAGGFEIVNNQAPIIDDTGAQNVVQIAVRAKLRAHIVPADPSSPPDTLTIDCGRKTAVLTGTALRFGTDFTIPDWQTEWFRIQPGTSNSIAFVPLGPNPVAAATATINWRGKYY
jgi:hypothetical protein